MLVTCAGILAVDLIAADLPKVSDPGELTFAPRGIGVHLGGHAGNVSIDLMKMGLNPGEVSALGPVGEDIFGDFIENILKEHKIVTHLQRVHAVATPKDLVLVVVGEDRRFHVDNGANWYISPDYVRSVMMEEKPLIFYVGGVGLMGEFDERLADTLKKAKEIGCLAFIDPVAPYKHGWDPVISALKWTDIFHCNKDEAASMTGKREPEEAAKVFIDKGAQLVVISLGEKGLIAETKGNLFKMGAFKVPVVDPTGAGDAFCAGVIRGLLRATNCKRCKVSDLSKEGLTRVLLEGEAAGAVCVTMVGTTTAVTKENVDRLLKEQGSTILNRNVRISPL